MTNDDHSVAVESLFFIFRQSWWVLVKGIGHLTSGVVWAIGKSNETLLLRQAPYIGSKLTAYSQTPYRRFKTYG